MHLELNRSLQVAGREVKMLHQTRERLFHGAESVNAGWVKRVAADVELSERLGAFSARFARWQDTVWINLCHAFSQPPARQLPMRSTT